MYLTRKSIFLLKNLFKIGGKRNCNPPLLPGSKGGLQFRGPPKKTLYSRCVLPTGSKGKQPLLPVRVTPGGGMAPGVKGRGIYIPLPSSSLRSSPIPLPCAHATPRTPLPPRPTPVVTTASRAFAVPTPPRAPTTSLLLPALAQRAPAAAW